ncbi:MAG: hypothetical protein WAL50_19505 [Kineosporiaceae bacterium]
MSRLTLARSAGPVVLALALVTVVPVPAGAETLAPPMVSGYRLSDLGTLGGRASSALAVNDRGQVVGYAESTTGRRLAFLWSRGGRIRDLGLRGAPVAINDRGQIAGTACSSSGSCYPFLWHRGRVTRLDRHGLSGSVRLGGMNEAGQIAGVDARGAFVLSGTTVTRPPKTATTRSLTAVEGINARGDVVGTTALRQGTAWSPPYRAALWRRGGGPVDLGALGAPGDVYSASHASAVNDRGQVVGWSQTEALPDGHAVVWDGGVIVDLGIAHQSAEGSRATDVNAGGVIVGQSAVAPPVPMVDGVHAVVWTPTGPAKR